MARAKPILPHHVEYLDEHFGVSPQWKSFHRKLRSEKFVDAVRQDTRSNRKLKRFSKMVGLRERSKQEGLSVMGDTGRRYKVKFHPEAKRFSCSCHDWTYKRSVKNRGRSGDCKHINRMKSSMKQELSKTASPILGLARIGRGLHREDKMRDEAAKMKIQDKAYKRHFPRQSLVSELMRKAAASVRGRAAAAFLKEAKKLSLHPRM